ncbi:MAG TPA: hypothetical protein K8W01_00415 [Methylorubrum populi]|uniref:Uncharacterized protein n=1 Tax=Methylorubrum populi TaxID=223967 RepID=A0A921DZ29_9HYPH|nr:hypothetical protein [Methylorubrum populi]
MSIKPVTNFEQARMRDLRAQCLSAEKIAEQVGRSTPCVMAHVRDMGIQCRTGRPGTDPVTARRILALADDGVPHAVIAERFGRTPGSMKTIVCRLRRQRREASASQEARAC